MPPNRRPAPARDELADELVYCHKVQDCAEPQHIRFSTEHLECEIANRREQGLKPDPRPALRLPWSPPFPHASTPVPKFASLEHSDTHRSHIPGMGHGTPVGDLHLEVFEGDRWNVISRFRFQVLRNDAVEIFDVEVSPAHRGEGWGRYALKELRQRFPGHRLLVDAVDSRPRAAGFWMAMEDEGLVEFPGRAGYEHVLALRRAAEEDFRSTFGVPLPNHDPP